MTITNTTILIALFYARGVGGDANIRDFRLRYFLSLFVWVEKLSARHLCRAEPSFFKLNGNSHIARSEAEILEGGFRVKKVQIWSNSPELCQHAKQQQRQKHLKQKCVKWNRHPRAENPLPFPWSDKIWAPEKDGHVN